MSAAKGVSVRSRTSAGAGRLLLAAIDASPASVAFTVDHQMGAVSAGFELRPTRLVAFGNPDLGTPLMRERPTAGIELARRHGLRKVDLGPISAAVQNFLRVATGSP